LAALTTYTPLEEDLAGDGEDPPADNIGKTFRDLGVAADICDALAAGGIVTMFPIQALALPIVLAGHDIIGQARTGTGKTLAFGVSLLQRLGQFPATRPLAPAALVVVPTRELAIQVAGDLKTAGARMGARILTVYGGRAYEPQIEALRAGIDVVVGTPGRLLDLARQGHLSLSDVRSLVLDEADKMLDLGFLPDVERILQLTPADRQTMLFSATMPGEVVTLARRHLRQPMHVRAEMHDEAEVVPLTVQHVFRAHQMDKIEMLARLLQAEGRGLTIVFCRTKRTADQVAEALTTRSFAAAAVHGDLGQAQRERAMRAFRHGKVDVLVATDVAARGLDVEDVTHVINYECPEDEKAYVHRIGRTGRAGRTGVAVTFIDWRDMQRWKLINDALGLGLAEPPETYSTSEHFYSALGIAPGTGGNLPRSQRARAGLEAEEIEDLGETGRIRTPARQDSRDRGDRGRDRGGRGRSSDRGERDSDERGRGAARTPRVRRRTRAGQSVAADGAQPAGGQSPGSAGDSAGGETGTAGTQPAARRRRSRRRRSGTSPAAS
jgi:superfamily II DNA/RNA helicase